MAVITVITYDSTTFVTSVSIIIVTPPPVHVSTTWTIDVFPEGSTTLLVTESNVINSTPSPSRSTSTTVARSTSSDFVTVSDTSRASSTESPSASSSLTMSRTQSIESTTASTSLSLSPTQSITSTSASTSLNPSPTQSLESTSGSTSLSLSPTQSTAANNTIVHQSTASKTTAIVVGVLVPLVVILIGCIAFFIWRARRKSSKDTGGYPMVGGLATAEGGRSICNEAAAEAPRQQETTQEAEEISDPPPPPIPPRSPFRIPGYQPPRPERPASISESVLEVMRSLSPGVDEAEEGIARDTPPRRPDADSSAEGRTQTYDGTRKVFYETALNNHLPFDQLARPSLRISKPQGPDPGRALTPEPLRIVKRSASTAAPTTLPRGRGGASRTVRSDPLVMNNWTYMSERGLDEGDDQSTIQEEESIDEETLNRQRENTLNYLEGVLPMSPPASYRRASSVYSRDQWGVPSVVQPSVVEAESSQMAIDRADRARAERDRAVRERADRERAARERMQEMMEERLEERRDPRDKEKGGDRSDFEWDWL